MYNNYRFILEKGSKKHYCPYCNKKRFVRYVDLDTGEYLPEQYGKCDRLINCGADNNPYLDGYVKSIYLQEQGSNYTFQPKAIKYTKKVIDNKRYFIPVEVLKETLSGYSKLLIGAF